jgi:hypothetical protein
MLTNGYKEVKTEADARLCRPILRGSLNLPGNEVCGPKNHQHTRIPPSVHTA